MAARDSKSPERGARRGGAEAKNAEAGERFLDDEAVQLAVEGAHAEGMTSAQIVEAFTGRGVHLSEATFRKWVQLGLLPRSRRVGRKGKHQGSLGLYPAETVRRIAAIKRLMRESLTIEDIQRSFRFREEIEGLERRVAELLRGLGEAIAAPRVGEGERQKAERLLGQIEKQAGELVRRIGQLERLVVEPLEREAKARAFGSGAGGGAADLL